MSMAPGGGREAMDSGGLRVAPLTELEKSRTTEIHQHRMKRCYHEFCLWARQRNAIISVSDPLSVDALLVLYVQSAKDSQVPFWRAKFAVLGVQYMHRSLRRQLPRSWDAILAWHLSRPAGGRVPMPELVLHGFVCSCWRTPL